MQERDQAIAPRRPLAAGSGPGISAARNTQLAHAGARASALHTAAGTVAGTSMGAATGAATSAGPAGAASSVAGEFSQVLAQAGASPTSVRTVVAGDTLTSMVKDHAQSQGLPLSNAQAHRWVQQIAQDNKISNVNRIFPGQQIAMGAVPADVLAQASGGSGTPGLTPSSVSASSMPAAMALQSAQSAQAPKATQTVQTAAPAQAVQTRPPAAAKHEVLDRTLDRAVTKGFIPPNEKGDVRDKILALASEHRFNPDDFARMTLMESDGMNPRATNQRCHGIIQFCGGPDRGAASAGYADNPKAILGLSVYQQLHLVDKYFDDVGLKNKGPAGLDDLYLAVLMPSARGETRADAPLNVSGTQARYLYEGRDNKAPITRQSILQGLLQNAAERLGPAPQSSGSPLNPVAPSAKGRLQAMRTAAYEDPLAFDRTRTQVR